MPTYTEIAAEKQAVRDAQIPEKWKLPAIASTTKSVLDIPRTCGLLSQKEIDITEKYSAQEIVAGCVGKQWSAEEVAVAFCKRAAIAQQLTNCLTEIFFIHAIDHARQLDDYLRKNNKPFGPLHGLPISLKDSIGITGFDATVGLCGRANQPATKNAVVVDLLISAGAVPYCKTTTPQGQLAYDTHSALWGRTLNPHNLQLTAGGSSGGEGALIAMGGSVLGVATDLAGSIRIPAAFTGIYALKPTAGRVPRKGTETTELPGAESPLKVALGPMGRRVEDLEFFMRVMEGMQPWRKDPSVLKYHLDFPPAKGITFGFLEKGHDGIVVPHPPVAAVLRETEKKMLFAGHRVRQVSLPSLPAVLNATNGLLTHGGSEELFKVLEKTGEPLSPWLAPRMKMRKAGDLKALFKLNHIKQEVEAKILKEMDAAGIDVLVCPVVGHAATPHDQLPGGANFTCVWNLLDYPAGVVPGRSVTEDDLRVEMDAPSLGRWDDLNRASWAAENRRSFLGAPIAVQVVARRGEEGLCLTAMRVVDEVLRKGSHGAAGSSKL